MIVRGWIRNGTAALAAATLFVGLGSAPSGAQGSVEPLFNGRDLTGWYTFLQDSGKNQDPLGVFKVRNGEIQVSGQKFGYISTEKEYENFRISVEYKWGQKKWPPRENAVRDAGLLYYVQGPDMVWANCLECQIQEGDTGDMWLIPGSGETPALDVLGQRYGGGKNYTRVVKWADYEKPSGEWNRVVVVARGNRVEHWVNGRVNMIGKNPSQRRGKIQLQSEGAELTYRNILIERLQ